MSDRGPGSEGDEPGRLAQRAAAAEVNGRRVNEAIERGSDDARRAVFVCECGVLGCSATVELGIGQYEDVRSGFDRFLVVPGHEMPAIEEVVERHPTYLVVAKRDGRALAAARAADDRDER